MQGGKFSSIGVINETGSELKKYKIEIEDYDNNKKTVYERGKEQYNVISASGMVSTKENDIFEIMAAAIPLALYGGLR